MRQRIRDRSAWKVSNPIQARRFKDGFEGWGGALKWSYFQDEDKGVDRRD